MRIVRGVAHDGLGRDHAPGIGRGQVLLADVKGGTEDGGVIRTIIDDEENAGFVAECVEALGGFEYFARPEGFVAKLEDAGSAFEHGFGGGYAVEVQAG